MSYAVATGHELTTKTAEAVLADGGSAVDACIAAAFTAFVVEPVLAGPLGGGFLMLAPTSGKVRVLDAFVDTPHRKAPENDLDLETITVDFGAATQAFHIGAGTIAAPCLIPALFQAHQMAGRMSMRDLVSDAVNHARNGHIVSGFQAHVAELVAPILGADPGLRALAFDGDKPLGTGKLLHNRDLADVIEVIAAEGPRFVTEGEVAQALLSLPSSHLNTEDLRRAHPVMRDALTMERFGAKLHLNPAPSLGGVQIALALECLPHAPSAPLIAEAFRQIATIRHATDLNHHAEAAHGLMLAPDRVKHLTALLAAHKPATRGTTHISVMDRDGIGAAMTLSNGEGCGRLLPGTGIHPNNMLGEEDLSPDGPLGWRTGCRLASMMCPMAMRHGDGQLTMLGSGGSNRIRSALTQTALHLIDGGQTLQAAIDAPRLHVEDTALSFEDTGGEAYREPLLQGWPEASVFPAPHMFFGGVHAVTGRPGRGCDAAGDPRRSGAAVAT
ncbi:gamma-glutamyltransferase [Halovulum sp. GXIMD14793]